MILRRRNLWAPSAWWVSHCILEKLNLTGATQTCIAILYCAITVILHIDNILPYLINTAMDGLMLIALSVVAIVVGKPLSYLNCRVVGTSSVAESASQLSSQLKDTFNKQGGKVVYSNWIGASKTTCYEMKAIWGLSIALWSVYPLNLVAEHGVLIDCSILSAFSAMCSVCLWRRSKTVPPKDMA